MGVWNRLRQGTKTPYQEEDASVGEPLLPGLPFLPGKVLFCAIVGMLTRCHRSPAQEASLPRSDLAASKKKSRPLVRNLGRESVAGLVYPVEVVVYYLRRRRAARPANASRESVAVVGSGTESEGV